MIIFEDEHLLVINKPAGINTHSPAHFAGDGIYEWLKRREPRWDHLAIIHRLDKETSGVIVFGKSMAANRSLTAQFEERKILKKYILVTDRKVSFRELKAESALVRAGEKYVSRPIHPGGERAETKFKVVEASPGRTVVEAEPVTGKTHQIRVHAAAHGFPILGDVLYGGTDAGRVFLHAAEISLEHPVTKERLSFSAPENFTENPRLQIRNAVIEPNLTDAYRVIHGAADGWLGWYVERLGNFLLSQSSNALTLAQQKKIQTLSAKLAARGVYHKILNRRVREISGASACPQLIFGEGAPQEFLIRENGIQFSLSFNEGYSVGLFLDQRENRRRFLINHVAPSFPVFPSVQSFSVLNAFSYTCGFSVCAAKAGAVVTSLDLSKKYLEWGKRNFTLNQINPAEHEFIYGDAFDWMRRLAKKGRTFDVIVLDPPTFSQSKEQGTFQVERDYGRLVGAALPLLKAGGVLLASTNAAEWPPEKFLHSVTTAVQLAERKITQQEFVAQPLDFPITREEPAYLKTAWFRII